MVDQATFERAAAKANADDPEMVKSSHVLLTAPSAIRKSPGWPHWKGPRWYTSSILLDDFLVHAYELMRARRNQTLHEVLRLLSYPARELKAMKRGDGKRSARMTVRYSMIGLRIFISLDELHSHLV